MVILKPDQNDRKSTPSFQIISPQFANDEINVKDIANFLSYKKVEAELKFKKDYLKWKGSTNSALMNSLETELVLVQEELSEIKRKLDSHADEIVYPHMDRLEELNSQINSFSKAEIFEAMKVKDGPLFELLKERGALLKMVIDRREDISRINIFLMSLPKKDKQNLSKAIRDSSSFKESALDYIKDKDIRRSFGRILSRFGFAISEEYVPFKETQVSLDERTIWVPAEYVEKINKLNEKLLMLSRKMQHKNAERQIRDFDREEEKDYASVQSNYLSAIKERDDILKLFADKDPTFRK